MNRTSTEPSRTEDYTIQGVAAHVLDSVVPNLEGKVDSRSGVYLGNQIIVLPYMVRLLKSEAGSQIESWVLNSEYG